MLRSLFLLCWLLLLRAHAERLPFTEAYDKELRDGRWGLVDKQTGEVLIPARYEYLGWPADPYLSPADAPARSRFAPPVGEVLAYREGGRWGLISLGGKRLTRARYADVAPLAPALYRVDAAVGNDPPRLGVIDDRGREV
ncbi:MAG: hypothetical protein WBA12_09265, partial [Catalinimonas sp.]